MKILTCMSTCRLFDDRPNAADLTRVFREGVESFFATASQGPLLVVDDGSTEAHRSEIRALAKRYPDLRPVLKPENGGTARSKNTALRAFADSDAEYCFLIDDDILFLRPGWQEAYVGALRRTGYHFLTFFEDRTSTMVEAGRPVDMSARHVSVNGVPLRMSPLVMGVLFAYDRTVLDRVGGFRIFPRKYGHWHTEHNYRCLEAGLAGPLFTDLADSARYVRLNDPVSVYSDEEKLEMARENGRIPRQGTPLYADIVD